MIYFNSAPFLCLLCVGAVDYKKSMVHCFGSGMETRSFRIILCDQNTGSLCGKYTVKLSHILMEQMPAFLPHSCFWDFSCNTESRVASQVRAWVWRVEKSPQGTASETALLGSKGASSVMHCSGIEKKSSPQNHWQLGWMYVYFIPI